MLAIALAPEACALSSFVLVEVATPFDESLTLWVEISRRSLLPGQSVQSHIPRQNGENEHACSIFVYLFRTFECFLESLPWYLKARGAALASLDQSNGMYKS